MTVDEIFQKLDAHIVKGIMYHAEMADYFDFLNLRGYKRLHEYQFLSEAAEMRGLHRYFINHFGRLIPESCIEDPAAIPKTWYAYNREAPNPSEKRTFICNAFDRWAAWEYETKKLYEQAYTDLCAIGEIAASCKIKEMISDVDEELKRACRMKIDLKAIDYDMPTIILRQDEIHEEYREMEKDIKVDIC
ncbi:MAG: hypothetical protein ACI3XQ_06475 [Eubacteriales bacterium]